MGRLSFIHSFLAVRQRLALLSGFIYSYAWEAK